MIGNQNRQFNFENSNSLILKTVFNVNEHSNSVKKIMVIIIIIITLLSTFTKHSYMNNSIYLLLLKG